MGVNGLWTVVQPCARPTNLATLNRKRLAVDASIWIYQFLKAVRDKEGNALRNSHVVGFFRRICKLLWFGIRPVFVFDGGAPALKRATLQARRRRREGRREDAVRTAGKLLAVQMQRIAVEEEDRRKRRRADTAGEGAAVASVAGAAQDDAQEEEAIPDADKLVYVEEIGMSKQERQQSRRFHKQDAYHLPELGTSIEAMGKPDDPRIMSVEELEEYARHFNRGENIDLYDFSKIDFDGEFFKSLPPADRYNILNAARLRGRLRMGLSKAQLDDMFPDRMAFSRFQIERVKERNHLTQRLMYEVGMTGTDLTLGVNARIAGEKNREYILVKNEGAEGGWALGVVSRDGGRGEVQNPIDVDRLDVQFQGKDQDDAWEDDEDAFVDVPVEGLNRLPKARDGAAGSVMAQEAGAAARRSFYRSGQNGTEADIDGEDSLFVGGDDLPNDDLFGDLEADEDEDLSRAIAMSLQSQHGVDNAEGNAEANVEADEDDELAPPMWTQTAVPAPRPVTKASGRMVAHIVNNRANAAVPTKRRRASSGSSGSDVDLQTALAAARKREQKQPERQPRPAERAPVRPNVKKPWDGPLPFEKIDWRKTIFGKTLGENESTSKPGETGSVEPVSDEELLEGGFDRGTPPDPKESLPLPPWLVGVSDIRDAVRQQQELDVRINDEDRALEEEAAQSRRRKHQDDVIEIESSDGGSDVEIIDAPSLPPLFGREASVQSGTGASAGAEDAAERGGSVAAEGTFAQTRENSPRTSPAVPSRAADSPDVEFEDVALPDNDPLPKPEGAVPATALPADASDFGRRDAMPVVAQQNRDEGLAGLATGLADHDGDGELFSDGEFDDFSDAEEEELLAQMAGEAEEHARFASTLNHRPEAENQAAYERELRALRGQQKRDRRDADEVTQIMVAECQALLRLFGIPYVTAPMEAEAQCAELVRLGLVDGIVTDDSDVFLFGGTRVYKNMFNSNKLVECYLAADLDRELSLAREQLVALALLLGSDYTEGLAGVGPVTAVEILSEFPPSEGGLAAFGAWWNDAQKQHGRPRDASASSSPFRRKFRRSHAARLFLPPGFPSPAVADAYLRPQVDGSPEPFQWGAPDLAGLRAFLTATIGWSQERTDEVLVPVIRDVNRREAEGTQSNITRFFAGPVGVGAREASAPRQQRARGSRRMLDAVGRLRAKTAAGGEAASAGLAGGSGAAFPVSAPGSRKRKKKPDRRGGGRAAVVEDEEADEDDEDDNGDEYHEAEGSSGDGLTEDSRPPPETATRNLTKTRERVGKAKKKAKAPTPPS